MAHSPSDCFVEASCLSPGAEAWALAHHLKLRPQICGNSTGEGPRPADVQLPPRQWHPDIDGQPCSRQTQAQWHSRSHAVPSPDATHTSLLAGDKP